MKLTANKLVLIYLSILLTLQKSSHTKQAARHRSYYKSNSQFSKISNKKSGYTLKAQQNQYEYEDAIDPDFSRFYDSEQNKQGSSASNLLDKVDYVKSISPYAQQQLKELRRGVQLEVGKPVYFEQNITYDSTPQIINNPKEKITQIQVPRSEITQEKNQLWNDKSRLKDQEVDFSGLYKSVDFKDDRGHQIKREFYDNFRHNVKIHLSNKGGSDRDLLIDRMVNPLKPVLLEKQHSELLRQKRGWTKEDQMDSDLDLMLQ